MTGDALKPEKMKHLHGNGMNWTPAANAVGAFFIRLSLHEQDRLYLLSFQCKLHSLRNF